MKKFFAILMATILTTNAAFALDKAVVKMGPVSFKSISGKTGASLVAQQVGDQMQITIGGLKQKGRKISSGTLTVFLPMTAINAGLSKNQKFTVVTTDNDTGADNEAIILPLGTSTKIKGLSSTTTSVTIGSEDSTGSGTLKLVKYNSETKELKFLLKGKVRPYSKTVTKGTDVTGPTDVNKNLVVKANVVITLP